MLLNEPFNDMVALYMAHSYECYEKDDPSPEEIAYAIEQNIIEHVSIYEGACKAISGLEIKDGEFVMPEQDSCTRQEPDDYGYCINGEEI